jgi:glucan biosynthesis protein C
MGPLRALSLPVHGRRPGLDVLRVAATLLVVMLHAGVPYAVAPLPGLAWPVRHPAPSPFVDLIFWSIEGAIMPLFFLLSGYGAAQTLHSRPDQFLASRWRRLGWPFLAAAVVLLPVELYVWLLGWAADGQISLRKLRSLKLGPFHQDLWGFSHLWYLEYLLLYSWLLWAAHRFGKRMIHDRVLANATLLRSSATAPMLLVFAAAVLWCAPEVVVGFQHSFFPVPAKFVFSGLFFAAGVAEFHRPSQLPWSTAAVWSVAGLLMLTALPLIHRQAASPLAGTDRVILALCLAVYAVLVTQAAWRQAQAAALRPSAIVDYLARASFWTYLVHHPVTAIWHIGLRPTGWPAMVQFTVSTLGTLAITLAGYEVLVRRTRLGQLLDGRPAAPVVPPKTKPLRRAA